jgi:hypothetical protein
MPILSQGDHAGHKFCHLGEASDRHSTILRGNTQEYKKSTWHPDCSLRQ